MPQKWLETIAALDEIDSSVKMTVRAFPCTSQHKDATFDDFTALLQHSLTLLPTLVSRMPGELEVALDGDSAQSRMFTKRFSEVAGILREKFSAEKDCTGNVGSKRKAPLSTSNATTHSVFFAAMVMRAFEILGEPASAREHNLSRKALRIRALADFYYSQAAALHHLASAAKLLTLPDLCKIATFKSVAPGIEHAVLSGVTGLRCGPIRANVLRVDPAVRKLSCCDVRSAEMQERLKEPDCYAVSGGFFLFSEAPILEPSKRTDPVGLLVTDGVVINPPLFNRGSLLDYGMWGGKCVVKVMAMSMEYWTFTVEGCDKPTKRTVAWHNPPNGPPGDVTSTFNRAYGLRSPAPPKNHVALTVVGTKLISISHSALDIPLAGAVIICPEFTASCPCNLSWEGPSPIISAMAGGPMLNPVIDKSSEEFALTAPPVTFSQDETFDQNLLPRMACGVTPSGAVIFLAVDGRDMSAPGVTLHILGDLMRALGCESSVNMDGGSSKRAIIGGKVVDTTSEGVVGGSEKGASNVRPLKSAIIFEMR